MALALLDEQLDELAAAWGKPRTPATLAAIESEIDRAAAEASRYGNLLTIEQLPSPVARAVARARLELLGTAAGVQIVSGSAGV